MRRMELGDLSPLRETLFAMRLLREEILDAPVSPAERRARSEEFLRENAAGLASPAGLVAAVAARETGSGEITETLLGDLARACGSGNPRSGPGEAFHGNPAPSPSRVPGLTRELLETINGPVAMETWAPAVRAFALHFLLRLVQPFDAAPDAMAFLAEAHLLGLDGFRADRMLLVPLGVGAGREHASPDPAGFVAARAHALVDRLGQTRERVRRATARSVALACVAGPGAGLNARQRRVVEFLAEEEGRALAFRAYVRLCAGRKAPSLRSLQRDWQGLREGGWIEDRDGHAVLDPSRFAFG